MNNFRKDFKEQLKTLNSVQKRAVENIDGPMLVVAGPGTGKTHILSLRVAEILVQTDTQPQNILCLTFTDAGARAMRERLQKIIGNEARAINIHTFHAFCNKVIQENISFFGKSDWRFLEPFEARRIIENILRELPPENILKNNRNSALYYAPHLTQLFQYMQREALSTSVIQKQIDNHIASLSENPEFRYKVTRKGNFQKGDVKVEKLEVESEKMELLTEAVKLYAAYEKAKTDAQLYNYDDLISWVNAAFKQYPFLLRQYQEQYLYILVDEFQDTNGAQNQILKSLIDFWQNPNIFIVGDDDQAIYEFQGARLENLLELYQHYVDSIQLEVLQENYRSTQNILDAAKKLIDKNQIRLINGLENIGTNVNAGGELGNNLRATANIIHTKTLHAQPENNLKSNCVLVKSYTSQRAEIADIAEQLEAKMQAGVALNTIAILYAQHKEAEALMQLCEKKGIPYSTQRPTDVLQTPIIKNLLVLLQYITRETERPFSDDANVFRVLSAAFVEISDEELFRFVSYIQGNENGKYVSDAAQASRKWRDVLTEKNSQLESEFPTIINYYRKIISWCRAAQTESPLLFLERVLNEAHVLNFIQNKAANQLTSEKQLGLNLDLVYVNSFFEYVRNTIQLDANIYFADVLHKIEKLIELRESIPVSNKLINSIGIVFSTAHGAKGLEFETVYIINALEKNWEGQKEGLSKRFTLPPTLSYSVEKDFIEARRRLFYVALTRAKSELNISFANSDDSGKPLQHSRFVDELEIPIETQSALNAETWENFIFDALKSNESLVINDNSKLIINNLLKDFKLSAAALNEYLRCPLSFFYSILLKIPAVPSAASVYGTAAHEALQKFYSAMLLQPDKRFGTLAQLIHYFEQALNKKRYLIEARDLEHKRRIGKQNLTEYFAQHIQNWDKNGRAEVGVNVFMEDIPLRGTIDKIVYTPNNSAYIVDYKTGEYQSAFFNFDANNKSIQSGKYLRQVIFYKILYETYRAGFLNISHAEIDFIDPDKKNICPKKKITFKKIDVQRVEDEIKTAWQKIQNQEFPACNKSDCAWCNFINQKLAVQGKSFANLEIESFDDD